MECIVFLSLFLSLYFFFHFFLFFLEEAKIVDRVIRMRLSTRALNRRVARGGRTRPRARARTCEFLNLVTASALSRYASYAAEAREPLLRVTKYFNHLER